MHCHPSDFKLQLFNLEKVSQFSNVRGVNYIIFLFYLKNCIEMTTSVKWLKTWNMNVQKSCKKTQKLESMEVQWFNFQTGKKLFWNIVHSFQYSLRIKWYEKFKNIIKCE